MGDVRLAPISIDDQPHAGETWEKAANKKFTILSNPDASVIGKYGLLHETTATTLSPCRLRRVSSQSRVQRSLEPRDINNCPGLDDVSWFRTMGKMDCAARAPYVCRRPQTHCRDLRRRLSVSALWMHGAALECGRNLHTSIEDIQAMRPTPASQRRDENRH